MGNTFGPGFLSLLFAGEPVVAVAAERTRKNLASPGEPRVADSVAR
jgi:hypothetical protein